MISILRAAISVSIMAGVLCACGQPPSAGILSSNRSPSSRSSFGTIRLASTAPSSELLYVSDNVGAQVYVFSYPMLMPVASLTGFTSPVGECVDASGDVWIANDFPSELVEYAHGGRSPIKTISEYGQTPSGCSVDPTTGNLGVANVSGTVAVYQNASRKATLYSDPDISMFYYATYDTAGNLFADGPANGLIAELPKGGSALITVTLSKNILPSSMQWDGKYLAIVDASGSEARPTPVDRVQVSGQTGTIVSTTLLQSRHGHKTDSAAQFWIQGDKIVGPEPSQRGATRLLALWRYPKGGDPIKELHPSGDSELWGSTVSP